MNGLPERTVVRYAQFASGLFLVFGLVGLIRTHVDGFTSSEGFHLLGVRTNPLTNLILLAAGLVGIPMALTVEGSRRFALAVGVVGVPFALLEFVLGDSSADIFGRDTHLALVQLAVAVLGLVVWAWSRPGRFAPSGASGPAP